MVTDSRPAYAARRSTAAVLALLCSLAVGACSSEPSREVKKVEPIIRDVPSVLRGTVGAEASIRGTDPVLVSGLGIVVGLNGTGGGDINPAIMATMERELAKGGVGKGSPSAHGSLEDVTPQEFLRSPNVAVVIVEARIAPGSPEDANFDVFVRTMPGSAVTSLEGGTLWTTDLRLGPASVFGARRTRKIGEARGPIYINPFSAPAAGSDTDAIVNRTTGRVLNGGVVTDPLRMELVLDSDSHSRARSVISAINTRLPKAPGDKHPTARGRGKEEVRDAKGEPVQAWQSIAISVPSTYKERPAEFLQLLRYTRIDQSFPQEYARQYVEELKARPGMSQEIGWCLKALGKPAVPFLVPMYDYPEYAPRMAALEAGAFLGDARAVPHLADLARTGPPGLRTDAIRLLARMPSDPNVNMALRELLDAPELEVRVAAYEGLSQRRDMVVSRLPVGIDPRQPKFILEMVPSREPLVYVTQQGEPRIVLFGAPEPVKGGRRNALRPTIRLNKPLMVAAWSDRLMFSSGSEGNPNGAGEVRMFYRNPRTGQVTQQTVNEDLFELVRYLASKPTPENPEPGLDFSYSEVVGTLYELSRQQGIAAAFATEQDRLRAEIYEAAQVSALADRPESSEDLEADRVEVFKPAAPAPQGATEPEAAPGQDWKPRIIPLNQPAPPKEE